MPNFYLLLDTSSQNNLFLLAEKIVWAFLGVFLPLFCADYGRPANPIRLMVGLLIVKHLRNHSDEVIVEEWQENIYYQYFCSEQVLQVGFLCNPTELVHFRNRIGVKGKELVFQESIRINGKVSKMNM